MEKRFFDCLDKFRKQKLYVLITEIVFIGLIVLMAFCKVNKGLDITDSAYSLSNFVNAHKLDSMWFFSTFYANILGRFFTFLPMGKTMLGLNFYTGLVKLALALVTYFFFTKEVKASRELTFLGVIVSVALCWCPTTILYNYLTYLFFFLGCMFLYKGAVRDSRRYLILAGAALGSNFFVRLPNICEAALIVALWIYGIAKREKFFEVFKKTLYCMLGFAAGLIPGFLFVGVTRGYKEYVKGIKELFEMTGESQSYSPVEMVLSVIRHYIEAWQWTEIACFALIVALLAFLVLPTKLTWLRYVLATISTLLFGILLYKKGLFDLNFHWFGPVYKFGCVLLSIAIVWLLFILVYKKSTPEEKLLAAISLIVIAITPLGSNNDVYSNLNNLFFVLPATLFLVVRFVGTNEHFNGVRYAYLLLVLAFSLLSIKFGATYVFRDGFDAKMDTKVYSNERMKGMKTTEKNAKMLTELTDFWNENNLSKEKVLLYGNVCGLGFYLDSDVAISTAWPSLPSFTVEKFEKEIKDLDVLANEKGMPLPTVVIEDESAEGMNMVNSDKKQEILNEFLDKNGYLESYSNDVLKVYLPLER